MRIVYIVKYIAQLGGLDRILSFKMNYLAQHGYEVHLITYEQGKHPISFPLDERIEHTDVDVRFFTRHGNGLVKRVKQYFDMRRTFKQRVYDKVKEIDPDVIVTLTDSYTLLDILMKIPGRAYRVIESHVERNSFQKRFDFKGKPGLYQLASLFDRYITRKIKKADCFVTLTQHDAEAWPELKFVKFIPNPLSYMPESRSTLENKQVLSVGRLDWQKGYDMLVDVWKIVNQKHPDWNLKVFGDGSFREELEKKTHDCGLDASMKWEHATPRIFDLYLESSIYVMSSRYEGFGLVLTEAMSCGVPCVSFNCPFGPSEIIKDGEDGLLVPIDDVQKLADSICRLIEDEQLRKSMGEKAVENVQRYEPHSVMKQWEVLFTEHK